MKPKTYPATISGQELKFIQDYLLTETGSLKAPALKATPQILKDQLILAAGQQGLKSDDLSECIFWIVNSLNAYPKMCSACCGPITKFHSFSRGYPHSRCSKKCSNTDTEVKKKKQQTSIAKYGTIFPNQSNEVKAKIRNKLIGRFADTKQSVVNLIEQQGFKVKEQGLTFSDAWTLQCECSHCFTVILPTWSRWNTNWKTICPKCSRGSSSQEKELARLIESFGFDIKRRDRTLIAPLEIDIFIPSLNLAIEFNGLYWHSDDRMRHVQKLEACKERGIKLIQIFEHDWNNRKPIVISRLKSALGLNLKIHARKTKVIEVNSRIAKEFFDKNHLGGNARGAKYFYALKYEDKMVQMISICASRFSKKAELEILRSASIDGITVVGGLSKLIKHASTNLKKSIMTYADRCWGEGISYQKAGGRFEGTSPPSYIWWKGDRIVSRYYTQKRQISKIIDNVDPSLSEQENMRKAGWRQLWNTGNTIYVFDENLSKGSKLVG